MTARFTDHILAPGDHASLPDPATTPEGAVYPCTTHNKLYRNDGGIWTTWATLGDPGTATALSDHLADTADAHDASAISFVPAGNIAATDVQAALAELDTEKAPTGHAHALDDLSDVNLTGATPGQALVLTSGGWGPGSVSSGGGSATAMGSIALLKKITLSSAAAQIDLTAADLPAGYESLMIDVTGRGDIAGNECQVNLLVNGDTGANYRTKYNYGASTPAVDNSAASGSAAVLGWITGDTAVAGASGHLRILLSNYRDTTFHKAIESDFEAVTSGTSYTGKVSNQWRSTAAITSLTLKPASATNFKAGTTVAVYGLGGPAPVQNPALLALKQASTSATYTSTSSTDADVDATNLAISFTVPASGKVLVEMAGLADWDLTTGGVEWTLREGTSTVAICTLGQPRYDRTTARFLIEGLTPGSTKTYKWGFRRIGASGTHHIYTGGSAGTFGNATMMAWDGQPAPGGSGSTQRINAQTGTAYTFAATDVDAMVTLTNTAAITATVPADATVPLPVGTRLHLSQLGAGQVTVAGAAGVTVNGSPGLKIAAQYGAATLLKVATDTWLLVGRLSA